jgi:hypothetical protein
MRQNHLSGSRFRAGILATARVFPAGPAQISVSASRTLASVWKRQRMWPVMLRAHGTLTRVLGLLAQTDWLIWGSRLSVAPFWANAGSSVHHGLFLADGQ